MTDVNGVEVVDADRLEDIMTEIIVIKEQIIRNACVHQSTVLFI